MDIELFLQIIRSAFDRGNTEAITEDMDICSRITFDALDTAIWIRDQLQEYYEEFGLESYVTK